MFKNRYILATTTISLIALQAMLWLLILKAKSLPAEVVFWYTLPTTHRLAPVSYLWIVPAIAVTCWLVNLLISWQLFRRYPATAKLLTTIAAAVSIMGAISVIKTILIYATII